MKYQRASMRRFWNLILMGGACLMSGVSAYSYTLTQTETGQYVRWAQGQKLFLAGNPENNRGVSKSNFRNAVVNALQQWKQATQGLFDFEYWQGSDPSIYVPHQQKDGLNSIFFASQKNKNIDENIVGHTQTWFNAKTGAMIETDVMLNDVHYQLTDDPNDTSSNHPTLKRVHLNNVITHELGHVIGLSHSNSINASMLYLEFYEQFKLGCDDFAGAKHLYPHYKSETGSLQGVIVNSSNQPAAGVVVTVFSSLRGVPIASVHTDQTGKFLFAALEPGPYTLMVDEYVGTSSSVPRILKPGETRICMNQHFPKNFVTEGDSRTLKKFQIQQKLVTDIGQFQIRCDSISNSDEFFQKQPSDTFVDRLDSGMEKDYTFQANGPFRVTAISHLMLSPIKVDLSILDSNGSIINPRRSDILYRSKVSRFKIEDFSLSAEAYGLIHIRVRSTPIQAKSPFDTKASSNEMNFSSEPLFILHFNDERQARNGKFIPLNARCNLNQSFAEYRSPPGNPIRNATTQTMRSGIGFCGTANASTLHDRNQTSTLPIAWGEIFGWMLPFLTAFVCQLYLKIQRAKIKE